MSRSAPDPLYLDRLRDYYAEHRSLPSYARLGTVLGLAAKSGVKKALERLAAAGFLGRTPDGVWVPEPPFFERTLALTPVTAGMPMEARDVDRTGMMVDEYLVRRPSTTTLVRVKGDSMVDAGIHDGDIAVVEKNPVARPGDLVIAIVDGEFTLKRLGMENGHYTLHPENKAYPVIRPRGALEIFGIMVGLMRRYVAG